METDGLFDWCWNLLTSTDDWASLPLSARKKLVKNLKICVSSLTEAQVSEAELLKLIEVTDIPTVFDAILTLWVNFNRENPPNSIQVLSYLRKVVMNSWKAKRTLPTSFHKEPKARKKTAIATDDFIEAHHPLNYRVCKSCGTMLRLDSQSDYCSKCKGNAKIEHQSQSS